MISCFFSRVIYNFLVSPATIMRDSVNLIKNRTNESTIVSYDTIYHRYHVINLDSDRATKLQNAIVTLLEDIKLS